MGSLDLREEEGEELGHRTCSAALRVGEHSDRHDRSHMRTLTYPVGRKLSTFTRTKQLIVALRAATEGPVLLLASQIQFSNGYRPPFRIQLRGSPL